jgi:hypothetical protein
MGFDEGLGTKNDPGGEGGPGCVTDTQKVAVARAGVAASCKRPQKARRRSGNFSS